MTETLPDFAAIDAEFTPERLNAMCVEERLSDPTKAFLLFPRRRRLRDHYTFSNGLPNRSNSYLSDIPFLASDQRDGARSPGMPGGAGGQDIQHVQGRIVVVFVVAVLHATSGWARRDRARHSHLLQI